MFVGYKKQVGLTNDFARPDYINLVSLRLLDTFMLYL